jgi:Tat protein translocase TatC
LIGGSIIGFYLVTRFDLRALMMIPIEPYIPEGQLVFTRPTDAFLITLKLSVFVGAIIAFPVIFRQVWGFLKPALYEREQRMVMPAVLAGLGLFVSGVWMAFLWVLPAILRIMLSPRFTGESFEALITAGEYFRFATQVLLGFGVVFELPLVMVMLAAMRLVSPKFFARNRPYAYLIGALVAAFVTPPDVFSMLMMMAPIIVLYEIGILIGRVIWKRGGKAAAIMILLGLALGAPNASAQERRPPPDSLRTQQDSLRARQDSLRADSLRQLGDTTAQQGVGLPEGPSRQFPQADSIIRELLQREGYQSTRYAADSLTFHAQTQQIELRGSRDSPALVEREGSILEADSIQFAQLECVLDASGDPKLFDAGTTVIGGAMGYDTCENRGVVSNAITAFTQQGVEWFMRGELGIDSASTRLYAGQGTITSSDMPDPDYHFSMGKVKWVTNNIMAARPVVLYVRDVPVMWLPFMFQDMRQGRRSGMLVPKFGINDIVRPNEGYKRHITNLGYFFALNDYMDAQASVDWLAETSVSINGQLRYRWLDRFITGQFGLSRVFESGIDGAPGGRTTRLNWNHQQQFSQRTRLSANVDFATSTRVLRENAVDPFLQVGQLRSTINFSKQVDWGTITIGGSRAQQISDEQVTQTFPDVRFTPIPISIGSDITWSPAFSFVVSQRMNTPAGTIPLPPMNGMPQEDSLFSDNRTTTMALGTPIRIGRWNLTNNFRMQDVLTKQRTVETFVDPADSTTFSRVYSEDFSTQIDWDTGINLPMFFAATWKLQPSLGVRNKTSGPFLLRNRFTGGEFIQQGKRLSFSAGLSPTFFGFFPGLGPISRIRHSIAPQFGWSYSPSAEVSEDFMRALNPTNPNPRLESPALHTIGLNGIAQNFEGKLGEDTTEAGGGRKIKVLSIQTTGLQYDFEQAKEEGRNGWRTQTMTNSLTSDLLRGFNLRFTHDLWDGPVGYDTTAFQPFLQTVAASFTLSGASIMNMAKALFGGEPLPTPDPEDELPADSLADEFFTPPPSMVAGRTFQATESIAGRGARGRGFQASVRYNERRVREEDQQPNVPTSGANRTVGLTMSFSPTRNWGLQWTTDYNLTTKEFGSNALRFERDMNRWRATFAFVQAPNGNFAFNFFVQLLDLSELRFNYDQRSVNR